MWLFLAALFMLFAATVVAYIIIRLTALETPAYGAIQLPSILWISTLVMIASSVTMQFALWSIRKGAQERFKRDMVATSVLAFLFLVMQTPGLTQLLSEHHEQMNQRMHFYGLIFFIVLLHALHVIGGLIPLMVSLRKALQSKYTQESHQGIEFLTMYWHFLDGVWIVLFATFFIMK
jgi:cytochrome c oxidase subunit 3